MRALILTLTALLTQALSAQQSVLEKKITIAFSKVKTENALGMIEKQSGVHFAYNADMFGDSLISGAFAETPLSEVLEQMLGDRYAYRVKGNYIIIKSTREIAAKNEKFVYTVSGYVRDRETGEILPFASVYDSATLKSTLTNDQGFYELQLEQKPGDVAHLGVSKASYRDTFIVIKPVDAKALSIALDPLRENTVSTDTGKTNLDKNPILTAFTNTKQRWQSSNFRKNFKNDWQISLLPFIGTNGNMSGTITNRLSFNILGGYAGGIKGVEFGGIFNIDRDTSSGAQFAGVLNLTAGPFSGSQFAGVSNNHFSNFNGGQFAGVTNTCSGNFSGIQSAGVVNFAKRNLNGIQAAGVVNYAGKVKGLQVAGVINTADEIRGTQIAGLVNTARLIKGTQIGFINVADTVKGLQLGFLSFCRSGIHQVEYSFNDAIRHNVTLRTGSKRFYNILSAGYHPYAQEAFALGYGVGSKIGLGKISSLNVELAGSALYLGLWEDIHSLYRLSLYHELVLFKTISLVVGPDFNFYYSNGLGAPLPGYKDPISFISPLRTFQFNQGRSAQAWVGFHVGIGLN